MNEIKPGTFFEADDFTITAFPVTHRGPDCLGFVFEGKARRPFLPEKADELGVPFGPERRKLVDGESLDYTWPGDGHGVRDVVKDALVRGYDGGVSIEPHMVVVFHDANATANEEGQRANYVEYGRRLERLLSDLRLELGAMKP